RHLVWVVDAIAGGTPEASLPLVEALRSPVADIRAQAARALGIRAVPLAVEALTKCLVDPEPAVRLQAIIALGRIGDDAVIPAIVGALAEGNAFLAFSAGQALRRIDEWTAAAAGLDSPDAKVRAGVLLAMEGAYDVAAVRQLARFATSPNRRVDERLQAL